MITKETILDLAQEENDICISIYLPTHKAGEDVQQDPIRFKNLLVEAEEKLKDRDMKSRDIDNFLKGPRKLLGQPSFWRHNDNGLAVFITDDDFNYYRIPYSFSAKVMLDTHFLITPLIPMITLEGTFCILTLSQKNIRFLKCTRNDVESIDMDEMPTSMDEFLKFDVYHPNLQHHAGQGGNRNAIFHGHGGAKDTDTKEVENYLKKVENHVTSFLKKTNDPLVLAGVDEAIDIYKKVNHYNRLLDQSVSGNPDPKGDKEIKDEAWEVIKSYFLQDMFHDIERFGNLSDSDKRSDNLTKIVEASYHGKIDSLFIPIGVYSWGWFDQDRNTVHHSAEPQNRDHDLINMASIKTLTQGGDVYAFNKEHMPNDSSIAAIFRYS